MNLFFLILTQLFITSSIYTLAPNSQLDSFEQTTNEAIDLKDASNIYKNLMASSKLTGTEKQAFNKLLEEAIKSFTEEDLEFIEQLKQTNEKLQQKYSEEIEEKQKQREILEQTNEDLRKINNENLKTYSEEIEKKQQQLDTLKKKYDNLESNYTQLQKSYKTLKKENQKIVTEADLLRTKETQNSIARKESLLEAQASSVEEELDRIFNLASLKNLESWTKEDLEKTSQEERKNHPLRVAAFLLLRRREIQQDQQNLKEQRIEHSQKVSTSSKELKDREEEVLLREKTCQQIEKDLQEKKDYIEQLEQQLQKLKLEIKQCDEEMVTMQETIQELKLNLNQNKDTFKIEENDYTERIEELQSKVKQLENDLFEKEGIRSKKHSLAEQRSTLRNSTSLLEELSLFQKNTPEEELKQDLKQIFIDFKNKLTELTDTEKEPFEGFFKEDSSFSIDELETFLAHTQSFLTKILNQNQILKTENEQLLNENTQLKQLETQTKTADLNDHINQFLTGNSESRNKIIEIWTNLRDKQLHLQAQNEQLKQKITQMQETYVNTHSTLIQLRNKLLKFVDIKTKEKFNTLFESDNNLSEDLQSFNQVIDNLVTKIESLCYLYQRLYTQIQQNHESTDRFLYHSQTTELSLQDYLTRNPASITPISKKVCHKA